jgi:hypothetical protein
MDALPNAKIPLTTYYIHTKGLINEIENYLNILLVSRGDADHVVNGALDGAVGARCVCTIVRCTLARAEAG